MRYGIIADVHANLAAFLATLNDMQELGGVDVIWCLGDIVGYGPDPHECIELLQSYDHVCVAGNHDRAVTEQLELQYFNAAAAEAIVWTRDQLSASDYTYLKNLPDTRIEDKFTLVHGSPRNNYLEYISSISIARVNFPGITTEHCFCGHTHNPSVFQFDDDGECIMARMSEHVKLFIGSLRLLINPGSVGQPRDGDPRASYIYYNADARVMRLRRVSYDIKETQDKMVQKSLPISLISRLNSGT